MQFDVAGKTLLLLEGDITKVPADAIVNAANSSLVGGSGVNGAILAAGGPSIMAELDEVRAARGGCSTGGAVATAAGELPARWLIHCVGPIYENGRQGEPDLLTSSYRSALRLAQEKGAKTVTLPAISTGVYGYPIHEAAEIALSSVARTLRSERCTIEQVTFVLFGSAAYDAFAQAARRTLA